MKGVCVKDMNGYWVYVYVWLDVVIKKGGEEKGKVCGNGVCVKMVELIK